MWGRSPPLCERKNCFDVGEIVVKLNYNCDTIGKSKESGEICFKIRMFNDALGGTSPLILWKSSCGLTKLMIEQANWLQFTDNI
jgi:hypothetical protein